MNAAEVIAWTWAGVMTGMALGVLSPDLRRRRKQQVDESDAAPSKVVQLPVPAPERLVRDLQLPVTEATEEIAVTVEHDREVVFDATEDAPTVEKILTKHQRRSKRNSSDRKRRRGHGRR